MTTGEGQALVKQPADAQARERALLPTQSFVVTAPAGSGKTGLLTQRVLQLLAVCEQPEEILCITFTRKAAAEMQQRITRAIISAASLPEHKQVFSNDHDAKTHRLAQAVIARDKEMGWHLLLAPNRLRIQTIDGLARRLAQQLPLASGLGALPEPLELPEFAYQLAVRETLKLLEQDSPLQQDLCVLLRHLDNNLGAVQDLLVSLLSKRDQWLGPLLATRDARDYLEGVLDTLVRETLEHASELLQPLPSELVSLAAYAGSNLQRDNPDSPIARCAGLAMLPESLASNYPIWEGLVVLLLTQKNTWRAKVDKRYGFPAGTSKAEKTFAQSRKKDFAQLLDSLQAIPGLLPQLQLLRRLPGVEYSEQQWQLLDSLTRLLPVLVAQLKLVFGQVGATDFIEITQAAMLALGQDDMPSDLALILDYRIRHILVDEFQDTSSSQLQLLEQLTAGWQADDARTLFIVGDGMQSCYGFRNANVGIFLDARQHGIGNMAMETLGLAVNFRSSRGVVDWVNRVFKNAFPAVDEINRGAVSYAKSIAFKAEQSSRTVSVVGFLDAEDRQQEADYVVNLVRQHQEKNSAQHSTAILVRNRPHLAHILAVLKRAAIPWQATDIDPLASRMAIVDAMSLTRALLDPSDRIAWLSILRAPWCGLDMHDLYHLANADLGDLNPRIGSNAVPLLWPQIRYFEKILPLSESGRCQLKRLRAVLEPAWQQRRRKPLRYWLEGVWLALGGPATLLEQIDRENIPRYFDLLEKHQRGGAIADWDIFQQAVARLYAVPQQEATPTLQVMTIHKAKGLEFDTVIIPGLDRLPRQDEHQLLLWQEQITRDGNKQLLLGPLAATGGEPNRLYDYMRQEQAVRNQLESNRLLYVGCTRAVNHLYLLANVSSTPSVDAADLSVTPSVDDIKPPSANSLLAGIWSGVKDELQIVSNPPTQSDCQQQDLFSSQNMAVNNRLLRLSPKWQPPVLADNSVLKSYRGRQFDDEVNLPSADSLLYRVARHTGAVIHRTLQHIVEDGVHSWSAGRSAEQRPFWTAQLRAHGVAGQDLQHSLDKVQAAVENMLGDATGKWILDNTHSDSACELSLWQSAPPSSHTPYRESVIDRTFIHNGYRWIIDYKSSEPAQGQSAEDFCAAEAQTYRAQLTRYGHLFQQLGAEPVKLALYFPLLPLLQEIILEK